jgi:hypothetical protein
MSHFTIRIFYCMQGRSYVSFWRPERVITVTSQFYKKKKIQLFIVCLCIRINNLKFVVQKIKYFPCVIHFSAQILSSFTVLLGAAAPLHHSPL